MTGKFLKDYLTKGGYQEIILESSPLLRTLETTAAIAYELGINKIKINYNIFEWLKDEFYPDGCPIDELLFCRLKTAEE